MARTITLRLEGDEISAQVFYQKVGTFLDMLRDIDRSVTEKHDTPPGITASIKWVVDSIHSGSPVVLTVRAEPANDKITPAIGEEVVAIAAAGLAEIESHAPMRDPPRHFTWPVLEEVHDLVKPARDGVTGVAVSTPERSIVLSKQATANLDRFLRPVFEHSGSVEGVLQMVSVAHGRPRFSIRDRITGRAINCTVPKERVPDVLQVFNRRVTVFGRVRTNERGDVLSIRVGHVEAFPDDSQLPTIRQVAGAFDLTGDKSVSEHLDWLRDAS